MKFNWGTGIFLAYSIFAAALFFAVYQSTTVDHNLVVDEYYERDLNYQKEYDGKANSMTLEVKPNAKYVAEGEKIVINVPVNEEAISGEVLFYRASDKSQDFSLPLTPDELGNMEVDANRLIPGRWKVEIKWKRGQRNYFDTIILTVPKAKS